MSRRTEKRFVSSLSSSPTLLFSIPYHGSRFDQRRWLSSLSTPSSVCFPFCCNLFRFVLSTRYDSSKLWCLVVCVGSRVQGPKWTFRSRQPRALPVTWCWTAVLWRRNRPLKMGLLHLTSTPSETHSGLMSSLVSDPPLAYISFFFRDHANLIGSEIHWHYDS